ncbi:MAG TPA: SDR family NAD(P)-dependent oxidoreductase [Acidimicrobiia bacterium]
MSPIDAFGRPQAVLLLGATSDIGRAIVARMVDAKGGTAILAGRDPKRHQGTPLEGETHHLYFDAGETSSHEKFFAETFAEHPRIDTVILAFGVLHSQEEVDEDPELAVEMANVNFIGAASALLHAASQLRHRGGGQIVVLSSVAGLRPRQSNYVYGASKAGIDFLARGLSRSVAAANVRILLVRPGFVHTKMTADMAPRPFSVTPETVANAVVDALARGDRVVWAPSVLRWVMGAVRLLPPSIVDKLDG